MRTLLLNSPAGHAPRAFLDQKTKRSDQVPFLVDHHYLEETETLQQQATGVKFKKILSKMLAICSLSGPGEQMIPSNRRQIQKNTEQNAHYLLTIRTRREREAPILEFPMKLQ